MVSKGTKNHNRLRFLLLCTLLLPVEAHAPTSDDTGLLKLTIFGVLWTIALLLWGFQQLLLPDDKKLTVKLMCDTIVSRFNKELGIIMRAIGFQYETTELSTFYLQKRVEGKPVVVHVRDRIWKVTNEFLKGDYLGIYLYMSPSESSGSIIKWGTIIEAAHVDRDWLTCELSITFLHVGRMYEVVTEIDVSDAGVECILTKGMVGKVTEVDRGGAVYLDFGPPIGEQQLFCDEQCHLQLALEEQFKEYWSTDRAMLQINLAWCVPFIGLMISFFCLPSPNEETLRCDHEKWEPMIPWLGYAYMPLLGITTSTKARQVLLRMCAPLCFHVMNIFWRQPPELIMPTMENSIQEDNLEHRGFFFVPNIMAYGIANVLVLFLLSKLSEAHVCKKGVESSRKAQSAKSHKQKQHHKGGVHEPLIEPCRQPGDTSAEGQCTAEESKDETDNIGTKTQIPVDLKARMMPRAKAIAFRTFYLVLQLFLFVWTDLMVYGGLMDFHTGLIWEMWSLAVFFELCVQSAVCIAVYASRCGYPHQNPAVLIIPSLMPVIGNWIHLFKDHGAQGLSFAMGHCSEGSLKFVGITLGYLGFAATLYPFIGEDSLMMDEVCLEGLIWAHWPVAQAGPRCGSSAIPRSSAERKTWVMNQLITACTKEKKVKATKGELPHTVLHLFFIYFFSGSPFIFASLFISILKLAAIPIGRLIINWYIEDWGCSPDNAKRYLVSKMGDVDKISRLATKMQKTFPEKKATWIRVLNEWWEIEAEEEKANRLRQEMLLKLREKQKWNETYLKRNMDLERAGAGFYGGYLGTIEECRAEIASYREAVERIRDLISRLQDMELDDLVEVNRNSTYLR